MTAEIPNGEDLPAPPSPSGPGGNFERFLCQAVAAEGGEALPLRDWLELAEAWRIAQALRASRGNRSAAARALGIGRRTLYAKMERLSIAPSWSVRDRADHS